MMILWYSVTIFVSAFLLFFIQPMVGKMVLPLYGGTSAVWNTCMVFFQAMLLLGYAYAHLSIKWLGLRLQPVVHIILLFALIAVLPGAVTSAAAPPAGKAPVYWLLYTLMVTVGLPFFFLSSSAPLLQRWFSGTMHPSSHDPYFLYAASNAGSLLGLIGYPLLIEPRLDLTAQGIAWNAGYGVLACLMFICGVFLWRSRRILSAPGSEAVDEAFPVQTDRLTVKQRLFWVGASFIPSSMMLSVTLYITTNVAAIPLIWVVPLAIYLLTFILVFSRRQLLSHQFLVRVMPLIIIPAAPLFFYSIRGGALFLIPVHLVIFFVVAMVCHGELARSRPSARHLTEFYVWMSVGGVLGGMFNALAAPVLFDRVIEYPLVLFLACLFLPRKSSKEDRKRQRRLDILLPLAVAVFCVVILVIAKAYDLAPYMLFFSLLFAPSALASFSFKERPLRFALTFGVMLISLAHFYDISIGRQLYASRNFFGVKRVVMNRQGNIRSLMHGTIIHGSQFIDPSRHGESLLYFHRSGPLGDIFAVFDGSDMKRDVAIIGLGVGSIASYAKPGYRFVFYEIDPDVEMIARNAEFFTFLADSRGSNDVVIGDGRLTIERAPDRGYGMIILDAFSSDAIPVHLLTKEALALYIAKLDAGGVIVFQISNNYLDLEPLLGNLAGAYGMQCLVKHDLPTRMEYEEQIRYPSDFVVMGRFSPAVERRFADAGWQKAAVGRENTVWTDRYSNVMSLLRW